MPEVRIVQHFPRPNSNTTHCSMQTSTGKRRCQRLYPRVTAVAHPTDLFGKWQNPNAVLSRTEGCEWSPNENDAWNGISFFVPEHADVLGVRNHFW